MKYEITLLAPNGDWPYWVAEFEDYHAAALVGIQRADLTGCRLHRITPIPMTREEDVALRTAHRLVSLENET